MGGKVSCTSKISQGTEFKIELTLKSKQKSDPSSIEISNSRNKTFVIMRKEYDSFDLIKFDSKYIQSQNLSNKILKYRSS